MVSTVSSHSAAVLILLASCFAADDRAACVNQHLNKVDRKDNIAKSLSLVDNAASSMDDAIKNSSLTKI